MNPQQGPIELFLKALEEGYVGMTPKTHWPLNGAQMDSYFDIIESLDMYKRVTTLQKTKTVIEIAELFPAADITTKKTKRH